MIELLRGMVRIPSLSFEEAAVRDYICEALKAKGIEYKLFGSNITALCSRFDPSKRTLALDAHIDTVPASPQYTRDPFEPGSDDSVVWGLGSNDDGASVVAMIGAFEHYYGADLPVNLMLVLSCEEERSGAGGAALLYSQICGTQLPSPSWVIVGEPTQMRLASSERGLLVLDGLAEGVSGHAARSEGVNALYIALEDIQALRSHRFERVSPLMGEVRLNVTQIQAGSAHNVIPAQCSFVVDIRPTDAYSNEEIVSELQALCRSRLSPRNLANRSSATPAGSLLLRAAQKLGLECFSSPTTSDWMRIGCEAVKMGPGDSARSHRADEYVLAEELENGKDVYIKYIKEFCDGYTLE